MFQIVSGLEHLHNQHDIVHRDLKPENILYSLIKDGQYVMKLADFGCSRTLPKGGTHYTRTITNNGQSYTLRRFGTDGWLAPEFLKGGRQFTYKGDIFPLGLIFAFILCNGLHPFGDDSTTRDNRIRNGYDPMVPLKEILDDGSYKLIQRMLNTDPTERPGASQVLHDEIFAGNQQSINQPADTAMGNSRVIWKVIQRNVEVRIFHFDFCCLQFYL